MKPETIWVCAACGRDAATRDELWERDAACGTHAVECYAESVKRRENGRVYEAEAFIRTDHAVEVRDGR